MGVVMETGVKHPRGLNLKEGDCFAIIKQLLPFS
jgi:hypothetical protein